MNIKMTTHNYQQLNLKNKNKANNQNRNRIISISSRLLSAGRGRRRMGKMLQGIRSIIGRYKIDGGMLREV